MAQTRRSVRAIWVLLALAAAMASGPADAAQQIDSLVAEPDFIAVGPAVTAKITARLSPDPDLIPSSVNVLRVDVSGKTIAILTPLFDDGTHGDDVAGDGVFTALHPLGAPTSQRIFLRASAAYRKVLRRTLSALTAIDVVSGPFFTPPDEDDYILDGPLVYPINRLQVRFPASTSRAAVNELAASIGARIVGFAPSANFYSLEVPTETKDELLALFAQLDADPRVIGVSRAFPVALQDVARRDLEGEPGAADIPYFAMKLFGAWNLLDQANPPKYHVVVGVIDTGVDRTHPEFSDPPVSFGSSPAFALVDGEGHGTSVAGIIGASDSEGRLGAAIGGRMNGVLAGVRGAGYTLESRNPGDITLGAQVFSLQPMEAVGMLAAIDDLAVARAKVVNISMGWRKCEALTPAQLALPSPCTPGAEFDEVTAALRVSIARHARIAFAISAGNDNTDAAFHTPSNVDSPNVVTVAATDRFGARRAKWSPELFESNFGESVEIAAPGESIVAPHPLLGYVDFSGTSAAAPLVAGAMATCLALNPTLSPAQLIQLVVDTGRPVSLADKPMGKLLDMLWLTGRCLPSRLLNIAIEGSGSVSVLSSGLKGNEITICQTSCIIEVPVAVPVFLNAAPRGSENAVLAIEGCDFVAGHDCQLVIDDDTDVSVTFGPQEIIVSSVQCQVESRNENGDPATYRITSSGSATIEVFGQFILEGEDLGAAIVGTECGGFVAEGNYCRRFTSLPPFTSTWRVTAIYHGLPSFVGPVLNNVPLGCPD